jgi:hypothetical protein
MTQDISELLQRSANTRLEDIVFCDIRSGTPPNEWLCVVNALENTTFPKLKRIQFFFSPHPLVNAVLVTFLREQTEVLNKRVVVEFR